ncbi:alpha/beta fold hydrolase [Demequina sp. SYSU T00039]|uniref:Alpha/beta fold hydrolase n=1 Tax=Demequina lignilytica TaxID=3051663 RepID=A0AAW7M4E4_9MICO|nr:MULTISPECIES: alpha/beta hydrolase [unclassified Demequina]MDN4477329.1 alpha/beta fold hydrolase [Demequina sp. SYSU T00039-1]MDN4487502.1 alpha/beta fold hydrolase [Demequina sp. SYSU T00039]
MRPVLPSSDGTVERDRARLHFDVYADLCPAGSPTIVLLPTWTVVHASAWKMQIPYLARHFRLVVFDAAASGRSTGPTDPARHTHGNRLADAAAVIEATCDSPALVAGVSMGGTLAYSLQAYRPELVAGVVSIGGSEPFRVDPPDWHDAHWADDPWLLEWSKFDHDRIRSDWTGFLEFFMSQVSHDPHSTKAVEDLIAWGSTQDPDVALASITDADDLDQDDWRRRLTATTIPTLIIHGTDDRIIHVDSARRAAAEIPGARLIIDEGAGHAPHARYPALNNLRIRDFADEVFGRPSRAALEAAAWAAPASSRRKVLYLSSPIGLGHARRDVAIAQELAAAHDVEIDWLAQDPVTRVLAAEGHRVHPASRLLASESAHLEESCGEHQLDVFECSRTMDEILITNFHVLDEVVAEGRYDLIVADEAWDLDYHLHETPSLKRAPVAWLTDFVGNVPMPAGGTRQAELVADYNLEMIEHVARHPEIRDASVFVGEPDDVTHLPFGPGLPGIREWTEEHFDFTGYIAGFDPRTLGDRDRLRASVGFGPREKVCVVACGGTGVGRSLLERVAAAVPAARALIPELRVVIVTGPRLDPQTMPQVPGVEYHAYVDRLYRWLAACDVAIVQGGLTTTMELTAAKVPFIYVPLRDHFEQNVHVRARLERYRAGRLMEYDQLEPAAVAAALVELLGNEVDYVDVETDGARRAAARIGVLL